MATGLDRVEQIAREVRDVLTGASLTRIQRQVGAKAKREALGAAAKDLGGDRAMRNFRGGKLRLGAGWDPKPQGLVVNLRPAGLWKLADKGRRHGGDIRPKRGHRAVLTPDGPRAVSHYKKSRGLNTISDARRDIDRIAAPALRSAIRRELERIVR